MAGKLEVSIRSLISHCEELAKDEEQTWRLSRYIKSVDGMRESQLAQFRHSTIN